MNKRDYVKLARAAVSDYEERGVPLTDSVKSAAADMNLNPEQTRRLVEFTNTVAHLHLFDKQADDKYVQFELVDPDAFATTASDPACEKVASESSDLQDFFLDLPSERRTTVKTAHDHVGAAEYIEATSAVDSEVRPYANGRNFKVAMRMQKLASELEIRTLMEYERYLDGARKLSFDLERQTDNEKRAFVANVRGMYPAAAEAVLTQLDVVNQRLELSSIKEAAAYPWESPLTDTFGALIVDRQRVLDTGRGYKDLVGRIGE